MQVTTEQFMEYLWRRKGGRKSTILFGDHWGDGGKREIEAAIARCFEAFVRVSGGANTGGTFQFKGADGLMHTFVVHQMPIGVPFGKTSIIGQRVCFDLGRFCAELHELLAITGGMTAPLYISKRAMLALPQYARLLEMWVELCKGSSPTGTTKRGISAIIAGNILRIGPQVGDLFYPDTLRQRVEEFYRTCEPLFRELSERVRGTDDEFVLADLNPEIVLSKLLAQASEIKPFVTDVEPILHDLAQRNVATLYGLTQGSLLHAIFGTYPCNSATESTAQAASYCSGVPMEYFGPIIQVTKFFPTRVGNGPFPTHWWDRKSAEEFPQQHPEYFSCLSEYDQVSQLRCLNGLRNWINSGEHISSHELAQYFQVLLGELGATTKRGRELGWPDLHLSGSVAMLNGTDCIALTRVDALSGLKMDVRFGTRYYHQLGDTAPIARPIVPTPLELLEKIWVEYSTLPVDLRDCDLSSIRQESDLPADVSRIIELFERETGVSIGILSLGVGSEKKIFRIP